MGRKLCSHYLRHDLTETSHQLELATILTVGFATTLNALTFDLGITLTIPEHLSE